MPSGIQAQAPPRNSVSLTVHHAGFNAGSGQTLLSESRPGPPTRPTHTGHLVDRPHHGPRPREARLHWTLPPPPAPSPGTDDPGRAGRVQTREANSRTRTTRESRPRPHLTERPGVRASQKRNGGSKTAGVLTLPLSSHRSLRTLRGGAWVGDLPPSPSSPRQSRRSRTHHPQAWKPGVPPRPPFASPSGGGARSGRPNWSDCGRLQALLRTLLRVLKRQFQH